jgi:hypothetical protein
MCWRTKEIWWPDFAIAYIRRSAAARTFRVRLFLDFSATSGGLDGDADGSDNRLALGDLHGHGHRDRLHRPNRRADRQLVGTRRARDSEGLGLGVVAVHLPPAGNHLPAARYYRMLALSARLSILLDETALACSFQRAAYSNRCSPGHEGANRSLVIGPLGTEIGAAHDRFAPAKLVGKFGLQTSEDRVGIGHAAFGGHCNHVAPSGGNLRSCSRTRRRMGARRRRRR